MSAGCAVESGATVVYRAITLRMQEILLVIGVLIHRNTAHAVQSISKKCDSKDVVHASCDSGVKRLKQALHSV